MKLHRLPKFDRDYKKLPNNIKKKLFRQLSYLGNDIRHPSLQAKRIKGMAVWEARVDIHYRLTFQIKQNIIFLRRVGQHDKAISNP